MGLGKKSISGIIIITLFASTLTLALNIQPVRTASPTIPTNQEAPQAEWSKPYSWNRDQYAFCVTPTKDGGYVVAGSSNLGEPKWIEGMIFKVDENGAFVWGWTYGSEKSQDYFNSVVEADDGGYVLAGVKSPDGSDPSDIWLLKTNSTGGWQWEATFGDKQREDSASCVAKTRDGGYIVVGKTGDLNAPTLYDIVLIKTNGNGIAAWNKTFGGSGIDFADSVQQTSDNGYIIAGTTNSFGSQGTSWLIKTNSTGEIDRNQVYGWTNSQDQFNAVKQSGDGGYVAAGYTNISGISQDFWVVKVNATLGMEWSRTYGGLDDEFATSLDLTSDGGYVIAGSTYSSGDYSPDFFVVKTDSLGNSDWSQAYGTEDTDHANSICETKDGGYIIAGYTYFSGGGISTDPYLIKIVGDTDKDGLTDTWERRGIDQNRDGTLDLNLSAMGTNWKHKDLFVEVDYMGSNGTHDHKPDQIAIEQVKTAFKNAPIENPDNKEGITLHVDIDEQIPHQNVIKMFDDFDTIKAVHFGNTTQRNDENSANILEAKKQVYRYCLFIHQYSLNETGVWETTTSSGLAETPGNDFIVSLGSWTANKGTLDEQAGTFMHELGHTLSLEHGGGDDVGYKPNYLSVMNYAFQMPDSNPHRPLDYSRLRLRDLDEAHLNENKGIGAEVTGQMLFTIFSNATNQTVLAAGFLPIDWNGNGNATDGNVAANINNFPGWDAESAANEILTGYDDWKNLIYNFRNLDNFADNAHGGRHPNELTWEIAQLMREAAKSTHDVAVLNLLTPTPLLQKGSSLNISLTLMNQGGNSETFRAQVSANATSIASQEFTLGSGDIATFNLTGQTADLPEGTYTLSASAAQVVGESDMADNTYVYGALTVATSSGGWVEWSRSYTTPVGDYDYRDVAYSVCQTADGGFALAGETGNNSGDFLLVKTYQNGSKQWDKTYGTGYLCTDGAHSVQQTSEGGFILAGFARSPQVKNYALFLVKTDSEGNSIWNKTYLRNATYWSGEQWVVKQTSDGGYTAAGTRCWEDTSRVEHHEMWLIRTDSAGKELWNKTYGARTWAQAYSVWQTADGGFVVGGYTDSSESTYGSALLIKTDSSGNHQWNKTFPSARIFSLQQTIDTGYILGGTMYYSGPTDYGDFWLTKTDNAGNTQWNKTYNCSRITDSSIEEGYSVQQTTDGGYVLAGYAASTGPSSYDMWIVKTDGDGNLQADLSYGNGPSRDIAYSVIETQDGAYVAAGSAQRTEEPWANDFLLVKFRIQIIIPEFPAWMLTPALIIMTLVGVVLFRKRKAP